MSDYVHLLGSEDVQRAGHAIAAAAETMKRAADEMDVALHRHQQFLSEWLDRFEEITSRASSSGDGAPK